MVKEIRVNGTKVEFEDDDLAATRTLQELSDGKYLKTDVIAEKTAAAGVTIDGLLIKDGKAAALSSKIITATRNLTAASGDVAYTGTTFVPTSIIAIATVNGSTAFPAVWGFADSGKAGYNLYIDSTLTYQAEVGGSIFLFVSAPGGTQTAVLKTYDATPGFTLTWTKSASPTGTLTMIFLCFR